MSALLVVEGDAVSDYPCSVHLAFETMPVHALLFQRSDHSLHQSVLLRAVWRDELLLRAIAAHQSRVVAAAEHQAIVRSQQDAHGCRSPADYDKATA